MRFLFICFLVTVYSSTSIGATSHAENWDTPYTGTDATGVHVLGYWTFDSTSEMRGKSRLKHPFKLQGAVISTNGRNGGALESFPGYPVKDGKHAAIVPHHPALSPEGKFTVEMWIKPKAEFTPKLQAFLLDKKYVAHQDYQWTLSPADGTGQRRMEVHMGFGKDSARFTSQYAEYSTNSWAHVAFVYDGAGTVTFFHNGGFNGKDFHSGRGAIHPGNYELSIGDRRGSNYGGFPGYIDQVRICRGELEFRPLMVERVSDRNVFIRMEKIAPIRLRIRNLKRQPINNIRVSTAMADTGVTVKSIAALAPGADAEIEVPIDTRLRPGEYLLNARIEAGEKTKWRGETVMPFTIVARELPNQMPVIMWGLGGDQTVIDEIPRLKEIGFTHCLGLHPDFHAIYQAGKPVPASKPERIEAGKRMLNVALANNLKIVSSLSPGRWARDLKEYQRVDRNGKPYARHDVIASHPDIQMFCENVGRSMAETYGAFPAYDAALVHSEVRGESQVSFSPFEVEAYRKATGRAIPSEIRIKNGVEYQKLKNFPADRIIADDDPLFTYYKWFWKNGDGWNDLHSAVHRGLKTGMHPGFWTFHDPAVRTTSVFGSGGAVDYLSQWTYSYPEPIRIGTATDELFAMAKGAGHPQGVMKMTQVIWYRSQTAPIAKAGSTNSAAQSAWEDKDPDAAYITIAPMHLREAFWAKLSRPIQGIMYHGWQSLLPGKVPYAYRYTHPQTQHELRRLVHEVIQPLGPTLKQIPDRPSDIAYLQSFASQMFARRGTYGWNYRWNGDGYLVLQYAQLQPEIVYEESIQRDGLTRFKMLVLFDCDVLTASIANQIREFQKGGGLVIGDENLAPGIKADLTIRSFARSKKADEAKAQLLQKASQLKQLLMGRYQRFVESDNPEVITRARRFGTSDYIFAINDHRTFGTYVGQHGLVQEDGLPSTARIHVRRKTGHVYDLLASRKVVQVELDSGIAIDTRLGPAEGQLFLIANQPIARVAISGGKTCARGNRFDLSIRIESAEGLPLSAIIPLRLDIRDSTGREMEFSGYYGARDGQLRITADVAPNDETGLWEIRATELASGQTARHYVQVTP